MDWFEKWMEYHQIATPGAPATYCPDGNSPPGEIKNSKLLIIDEKLTEENVHSSKYKEFDRDMLNYTGRSLKDNLQLNIDFTVITDDLFTYLERDYGWDYPILRYGTRDVSRRQNKGAKCHIDFYLRKLSIIDVPKDPSQKDYEIILVPQNQKVYELETRIIKSRESDELKLWKLQKPNLPFKEFYNTFIRQFKKNKKIMVEGELLSTPDRTIGSLRFSRDNVLTVEHQVQGYGYVFEAEEPEEELEEVNTMESFTNLNGMSEYTKVSSYWPNSVNNCFIYRHMNYLDLWRRMLVEGYEGLVI